METILDSKVAKFREEEKAFQKYLDESFSEQKIRYQERFNNLEIGEISNIDDFVRWRSSLTKEQIESLKFENFFSERRINNDPDLKYLRLVQKILLEGQVRNNRTGVETISLKGSPTERYNIRNGELAILRSKKVHVKSWVGEILWIASGKEDSTFLVENGIRIWKEWSRPGDNYVGHCYPKMWRDMPYDEEKIDQLKTVIETLRNNPNSRQNLLVAFNQGANKQMAAASKEAGMTIGLPACHSLFQNHVEAENDDMLRFILQLYQRSCDIFLGVPFNIAEYCFTANVISYETGLVPHEFVHNMGDYHIYKNHIVQILEQLTRTDFLEMPIARINLNYNKNEFNLIDAKNYSNEKLSEWLNILIKSINYTEYEPHISGTVAV
jgi:thymidylate synthase